MIWEKKIYYCCCNLYLDILKIFADEEENILRTKINQIVIEFFFCAEKIVLQKKRVAL
jgi:hypothetical protein